MSEVTQAYLELGSNTAEPDNGFDRALTYIREHADSEYEKGRLFERLIRSYLLEDAFYKNRFSAVYLWAEWAERRPEFDAVDTGIDIVAEERAGGYCAIQCKCYAENTRITKAAVDTFIAASAREPFTARIFVDTSDTWSANVRKTLDGLRPACQRISAAELASRPVTWPELSRQAPEQLAYRHETFRLRTHQREAFDDVVHGFKTAARGKLLMACGTGKTFTALRIAEHLAGVGGRVLYLVPSIGLFSQAMREWAEQQGIPHRYIGICSDTKAGKTAEDASFLELELPVTTAVGDISAALQQPDADNMRVVFCTYHSLPIVETAQKAGAPPFDIVLCDEAHRTTGVEAPDDTTSPFVLIHDAARIHAKRRLYMTATSRLYTAGAKAKAARHERDVYSMDDAATYGAEFHRLPFSRAVEQDLLSDYKVVVLAMSEQGVDAVLQKYLATGGGEININDATKIVGCWRALQNPERKSDTDRQPLRRAIAFSNTIAASKSLVKHWNGVIDCALQRLPDTQTMAPFECETEHVDGKDNALLRKKRIEWLKGGGDDVCRILSNARCLSEGIDVPALDAVLFMTPRNSYVDIVQAVGRVMRKSPGKTYGYIILPVAIPEGAEPGKILNDTERFKSVWNVLRALRSHDDRLNAEINSIDINTTPTQRIIFEGEFKGEFNGDAAFSSQLTLPLDIPADAIFAQIVEQCGDRKYWESWAKDVADIFLRVVARIDGLLRHPANTALQEWFDAFHTELKRAINAAITRGDAIDMMAQHIITNPVFDALFENYVFASSNPVAMALDTLRADFAEFGLLDETRELEGFYDSVRMRARGIDNSAGKQRVLLELYEKFFATALKQEAERLGIVYTPVDIVDFILKSADDVLTDEFGRSISDEGVHVLEPFAGVGTFLARLLQSELIAPADVARKYREELHANEIVLLAYYIAAINIAEAFRSRHPEDTRHEPFNGIALTDTFTLNTTPPPDRETEPLLWLMDNNERTENQQERRIRVIVGNPPWHVGQKSAADDNPNVHYPALEKRIRDTYVAASTVTNKNSLYDTYKMALRWASDRIGEEGVIAFVTNGSWVDGNADAGLRACLASEFSSIYVLHLRGDARTSGERRRAEGGNAFGSGSRTPVAITILVKNPHRLARQKHETSPTRLSTDCQKQQKLNRLSTTKASPTRLSTDCQKQQKLNRLSTTKASPTRLSTDCQKQQKLNRLSTTKRCEIRYRDIGDYLTREEKLAALRDAGSIKGVRDWQTITPNAHHDWVNQRSDAFARFYPMGTKETKAGKADDAIFKLYSCGYKTGRDAYLYNFSHDACLKNARRMTQAYRAAIAELEANPELTVDEVVHRHNAPVNIKWDRELKNRLKRRQRVDFKAEYLRKVNYRPFVSTNYYADYALAQRKYQMDRIFPPLSSENRVICVPGIGSKKPFSALITDTMPELGLNNACQCFPRWQYAPPSSGRLDNISDTALSAFRAHYRDDGITKDAIFDYVYGMLHSSVYRERFANDVSKMLPRIPFAPDFNAFSDVGAALARLHLNYESCEEYPLSVDAPTDNFRLSSRAMRFSDKVSKETLIINDQTRVSGIPCEAHRYVVNGRTPLEWLIDRYKVTRDKESGIINDANEWFAEPDELITVIKRLVYVSVTSIEIIEGLPSPLETSQNV